MKKRFRRTRKLFKTVAHFNPRAWADYDRMRETSQSLWQRIRRLFVPQKARYSTSFEEKTNQLQLTEIDLKKRMQGLLFLSILMLLLAGAFFSYCLYQLWLGHYLAVMVSAMVTLLTLALAFRYHFWYFQIKQRKLGCTIREWFNGLRGVKP